MNRSYVYTFLTSLLIIILALTLQDKLSQFRSLGLVGIFLVNFFGSATLFLPAPAIASVVAGGALYPPLFVALVSAFGAALGDMIGFVLGLFGKHLFFKEHGAYITLENMFKKFGGVVIFILAFIPNPLFDAIGIIAGALSFSPSRFFLLLFAGRLLRDILLAYVGASFAFAN